MSEVSASGRLAKKSGWTVPFVKPREEYAKYRGEIDAAIFDCLENGDLIHRRQLFDFEANLAEYVGTKYAVGLNSGYHALFFALLGAEVGPGDEVITVAHTFAASVSAIVHTGATPVLVEVGPDFNMDMDAAEAAVTEKTKAIMPVHLNGRICDMGRLGELAERHDLAIVEDACQALGARFDGKMAGSFGHGCFSFYPFKALGCYGDGGALTTDNEAVAKLAIRMRYNGEDRETGDFHYHGYTALLDNVHAAVLDVKLRHFPDWVDHRRSIAGVYRECLADLPEVAVPHFEGDSYFDSYQNYVLRAQDRDALRTHLAQEGVESLVSWPKPMWRHAALELGDLDDKLGYTIQTCNEVISLPMNALTTVEEAQTAAQAVRGFYAE